MNVIQLTLNSKRFIYYKSLIVFLNKLNYSWASNCFHLSYGMVELPEGKMKSREGTVVDADELLNSVINEAKSLTSERGFLEELSEHEILDICKKIGNSGLKYFLLKVDPKKRILFDPKASVDFQGNTGPFIQYTYARIQSILRTATFDYSQEVSTSSVSLHIKEKELIKQLELYPDIIQQAADNYSPALIANYTYDLVKEFNSFYQNVSILGESNEIKKRLRVQLADKVANVIKSAFSLLGIQVPNRM